MNQILKRFEIGKDFSQEDFLKWKEQLTWWIAETMPNVDDPAGRAKKTLLCAMNGTKLNGEVWPNMPYNFYSRVKLMAGFDLEKGVGVRRGSKRKKVVLKESPRSGSKTDGEDVLGISLEEVQKEIDEYKLDLLQKYPHLENPVYDPKVNELSETIIKSRLLSVDFLTARDSKLEKLSKIRESLHRQIGELMDFLEISPKYLIQKQRESEKADVGSLIAKLESYGTHWQEFERIDAIRELIQKYHQLNSLRPDGTPQLNDWELWHQTRTKPIHFRCRCGEEYELLDGFTPEEIEQALEQAYEVYGFGLEKMEEVEDSGEISEEVLFGDIMDDEAVARIQEQYEEEDE